MSGLLMGKVYNTTLPTNMKTVLGAYADHANDDGTSIFPGEARMIIKTSLSKSSIRRITSNLTDTGLLHQTKRGHTGQRAEFEIDTDLLERIQIKKPPRGSHPDTHYAFRDQAPKWVPETNEWVPETTREGTRNERVGTAGSTPNVTEPSEPSENHQIATDAALAIEPDYQTRMKNAVVDAMGWDPSEVTAPQWGAVEKAGKHLRDIGADPVGVARRAMIYRVNMPEGTLLTPMALAKHWADCAEPNVPVSKRDVIRAAEQQRTRDMIAAGPPQKSEARMRAEAKQR